MATILFGKNDTGEVFEVRVKASKVQSLLGAGYVCDPAELSEEGADGENHKDVTAIPKDEDDNAKALREYREKESGLTSAGEEEKTLRELAKEAGIGNWHNKKIDTLKGELGYVD